MQNQVISELYTDDKKSKFSSILEDILKSVKKIYENLYPRKKVSKSAINKLLNKIPLNKKISKEHFFLCEAEMFLDEIVKAINAYKNNKSPGNDGTTAEFYKHFANELALILVEVYDYWKQLGIIGISFKTSIILVIYKKGDKKEKYGKLQAYVTFKLRL